jgi:hypothetical protein
MASVAPQPQPLRELVSDTNDADDSGVGDEEDGQETSTEEERPKTKDSDAPMDKAAVKPVVAEDQEEGDDKEEDEEEEDEDPEIRRKRELRERMAKMSGGMGMMGMFGAPGGMGGPSAARKPKPAPETNRQSSEQHREEPQERDAPVRIMALPGMSTQASKQREENIGAEDSDEGETVRETPRAQTMHEGDDYISSPVQRRSTDRAAPPVPHGTFQTGIFKPQIY